MTTETDTPGSQDARTGRAEADIWKMLADIGQSLQMSAASIKAAVSSLLDTSIIWDRSAQHEFMVSINQSIDRTIPLILAMTLAMKTEGGTLGWVIEPCSIQEILTRVVADLNRDDPAAPIVLTLPAAGKPVIVDYEYLLIALKLLLESILAAGHVRPDNLQIAAVEDMTLWRVYVSGDFSGHATELIAWLGAFSDERPPFPKRINAEIMLRAFTAVRVFDLQHIRLITPSGMTQPATFHLEIPATGK